MRSKPGRYRKPTALEDAVSARVKELPYGSESEYVLGLIRYDLATRKDHTVTAGIAELPRTEQDKIDDEIARAYAAGESIGGSWFEHRLKEAVEAVAEGKDVPKSRVARELLKRIRK